MKPAPMMTTSSPSCGAAKRTELTTQDNGSATSGWGHVSATGTQKRSSATTASEKPPSSTQHATREPGSQFFTSLPTWATMPETSCPSAAGNSLSERPNQKSTSDVQTPHALTCTSTS